MQKQVKKIKNFMLIKNNRLGKGSTGSVYEGYEADSKQKVAIKVIDKWSINNEVAEYLLKMEKKALMMNENKYLLKGIAIFEDSKSWYLVTEFFGGGTLKNYILNSPLGYVPEDKALSIFFGLLRGCKSMIEKGILHRDLKTANVMIHDNMAKIIDFGYCEIEGCKKPSVSYNVGSPSYMAPESTQYNIYNEKTQVWSLGIILYEMLTGKTIDEGRSMIQVYYQLQNRGPNFPSHVSNFSRSIINWCLKKNPKQRPTYLELLETYFPKRIKSKTQYKNLVTGLSKPSGMLKQSKEQAKRLISPFRKVDDKYYGQKFIQKQLNSIKSIDIFSKQQKKCIALQSPKVTIKKQNIKDEVYRILSGKSLHHKQFYNLEELSKTQKLLNHYESPKNSNKVYEMRDRIISRRTPPKTRRLYQMQFEEEQDQQVQLTAQKYDFFRA